MTATPPKPKRRWYRPLVYGWAFFPNTLIGLMFLPLALLGGGRCRRERGCLEIHGGLVTWFLKRGMPWIQGASAMTLGHVVIGQDETCLAYSRDHEHVHVRQYERWGPFFLPAYLICCVTAWWRGEHPYRHNWFEKEAYGDFLHVVDRPVCSDSHSHENGEPRIF